MVAFRDFLKSEKVYEPKQITEVLKSVIPEKQIIATNKKIRYYNIPCAFDIETSSFFRSTGNVEEEKVAIMYEWTFGINGAVFIGRTWDEFITLLNDVIDYLELCVDCRLCVYVHNLSYEFQFFRKWLEWEKVFSISDRKPIYALTRRGLEFRCSYLLSGYSLEKLGDQLHTYKVKKLVGGLNYDLIRHHKTPLTDTEILYCVNDVKVVMAYIMECMENDGDITRLPLTKTGYVRNYCRNECFYEKGKKRNASFKRQRYMDIMRGLRLTPDEYKQLKRAFQGGFTHANPFYSGKIVEDVDSFDYTSSYPAVMVAEQFPMSSSEVIQITNREDFEKNLKLYCCLFDVEFEGLQSQIWNESYLSVSRCWGVNNAVINNGRIVSAKHLFTTLTEQDFAIIKKFYTWDKIKIGTFRRYRKGYLPTDFVKSILTLYKDKTTLKGVEDKEIEYLKSKEMINSCYGMAVTDIVRDECIYTDHWLLKDEKPPVNFEKEIEKYNNNSSRFLFYPWGVWVTAYARRNLFTGILEFGDDYVYSDTDSIKGCNAEQHKKYIEKYNEVIRNQLYKAMDHHGLPREFIEPETIKGEKKCLGVWDYEGRYTRFKTLGAKRYMIEKDGNINITVSGLNKKICVPYLVETYKDEVFEKFNDSLYIPAGFTGKNTHTYIDEPRTGEITDYLGNTAKFAELSGVHLMASDYSLSISREYSDYIRGIQEFDIG